jgi:acetyl-CoA acyltransferase
MMADAFILNAVRTPLGKRNGALAEVRAEHLAAHTLKAVVDGVKVAPGEVEDVVMGCVTQLDEQGLNIGRTAVLAAGWPVTVAGTSVNRQCGSSLQAVNFAAQAIMAGQMDMSVGAGVESMTRVGMGADAGSISPRIKDRFDVINQGLSAEFIAERYGFTRESMDSMALESHRRALEATEKGYFSREIAPISAADPDGNEQLVSVDQGPRAGGTAERLAKLRPAFKEDGRITAATSSQITDGSSAVLMSSKEKAEELGLTPRARIVATSVVGTDPTLMLLGPAPATRKALKRAGMNMSDIGLFEVNEAFASVVMAWQSEMDADLSITNVNGGAMALGHPLGCTGARLITTLLHEMERRDVEVGLATLCIGWGLGVATIIERV